MLFGTLELLDNMNVYSLRLIENPTIVDKTKALASASAEHPDELAATVGKFVWASVSRSHTRASKTMYKFEEHINEKIEEVTTVYWSWEVDRFMWVNQHDDASIILISKGRQFEILFPSVW